MFCFEISINSFAAQLPAPAALFEAWKDYIAELKKSMPPESLHKLRDGLVNHAREVATAAGGILGIGSISKEEDAVLGELKAAFE